MVLTLKRDVHTLEGGHPAVFSNVAFSPDGKILASCDLGADGLEGATVVKLWDVEKRKVISTLAGPIQRLSSLAFSPDGKTLAVAGRDKDEATVVRLWDVASGKEQAALKNPTGDLWRLALSPDGKVLAWGGRTRARQEPRAAERTILG